MTEEEFCENVEMLPIVLVLWIPMTLSGLIFVFGDVLWFFGDTYLVTEYYTRRFSGPIDANLWLIGEIGIFGCFLFGVLIAVYCRMSIFIYKTLTYRQ